MVHAAGRDDDRLAFQPFIGDLKAGGLQPGHHESMMGCVIFGSCKAGGKMPNAI